MDPIRTIRKDVVFTFGDCDDGAIGIPIIVDQGRVVEASYFYGKTRPKNIVVISSQVGCPMRCSFCELGAAAFEGQLTAEEMRDQALIVFEEAARLGFYAADTPHKITVANSGEPLYNPALTGALAMLSGQATSFKVSTVFPDAKMVDDGFEKLADFAASCGRPVQLQISLISTSEAERKHIAGDRATSFEKIRRAGELWRSKNPAGRKINLSLILTEQMAADVDAVTELFPPDIFRFRFREYVPTVGGKAAGLKIIAVSRLAGVKQAFADRGYEIGDWASPSPIERRFGLASNVIRRMYLDMIRSSS